MADGANTTDASNASTAVIPTATSAAPPVPTSASTFSVIQAFNIKAMVPTLDVQASNYSKWRNMFLLAAGRFNLKGHLDGSEPDHGNPEWARDDLTVLGWIYVTVSDELLQMIMAPDTTAFGAFSKLEHMFRSNKMSRAVHLESEFRSLVQGDLTISAYCHRLKTLTDGLADCDQEIQDHALVLQLIRGLSSKFSTLKSMLPMMRPFPTFMEARGYLLLEETSQDQNAKAAAAAALLAAGVGVPDRITNGGDRGGQRFDNTGGSRDNNTNARNNSGGGDRGRGNGGRGYRGRGRGNRGGYYGGNGGRSGGQSATTFPWYTYPPPVVHWRAPWTGATGPGSILGPRPQAPSAPAQPQAYPMMVPPTVPAWDTSGLINALNAAQGMAPMSPGSSQASPSDWYMDTGASSHMTGEHGPAQQDRNPQI